MKLYIMFTQILNTAQDIYFKFKMKVMIWGNQ